MATIGDIIGRLILKTDGFSEGISKAKKDISSLDGTAKTSTSAFDGLSRSINNLGGTAAKVGGALSGAITVPLTIAAKKSIDAARDFETSFTGVRKTVNATEEEFAILHDGILKMSQDMPTSANEIASVAEAAGQLGIQKDAILSFTKTMIDLGNTTNLTSDQAATEMARFANIMKTPQDSFDRIGATIVDLGNNLATTEAEISSMAQRLAGAGKSANLTESDILSIAGALSSVGIKAESGGTAFSRVFIKMGDAVDAGGDKLDTFAQTAGLTADQFAQKFQADPAQAVLAFVEGLGKIQQAGNSTTETLGDLGLGEIRVRDALTRLANNSEVLSSALTIGNTAWKENTALVAEAAKRYGTTDSTIERLNNSLDAAKIALGEALLPVVKSVAEALIPLIQGVGDAIKWFQSLDPAIRTVGTIFITTFALGGPALLAFSAFVAAVGTLSAPLLIGGAIVAGIVAGVLSILANWETIKSKGVAIWEAVMTGIQTTVDTNIQNIQQAWASLKSKVVNIAESMGAAISKAFDVLVTIGEKVSSFKDGVIGIFSKLSDVLVGHSIVPDMIEDIGSEFGKLQSVMVQPTQAAADQIIMSFNKVREAQANSLGAGASLDSTTANIESNVSEWSRLFNSFRFTSQDAFQQLANSLTQVFSTIRTGFVNSIVGMIAGTTTFAQFLTTMWQSILAAFLNLVLQMGIKWAITQLAMTTQTTSAVAVHTAAEETKTAITAANETARVGLALLSNKAILAGAASTIAAMGAMGLASMAIMAVVGEAIAAVFLAIAVGLTASVYGAFAAAPFYAAAAATSAAALASAATGAGAVGAATEAGLGLVTAISATPFAEGGAVFGPTLALIGEAGPEVVAPFSEVEKMLNSTASGNEQQIVVMLDGRVIARNTMKHMPSVVRAQGVPL